LRQLIEEMAENAGRVHSLLESIEENCNSGILTFDDIATLTQYCLAYNENVFSVLDKMSEYD
jgi:ABC-type transporter Mla subunit MlaD